MKKIYDIEGMHCRSCEILIEDELKKVRGVKKVHANSKTGEVAVYSDAEISSATIESAVKTAGYNLGKTELPLLTQDSDDYKYLVIAAGLLIAILVIGNIFGLSSLLGGVGSTSPSLLVVAVIGLTAGFSSCMALVGGLVLGISARFADKHPEATTLQKFRPHLFFNLGRILSYIVLGGAIGALGGVFRLSSSMLGIITIFVGLVMLSLGLQLTELFPRFSNGFTLPKGLTKIFGIRERKDKEYSHTGSMILGSLTFFLPCGFTQAMQVYAISTGSAFSGALIMGVFALGTTPGLLGIGGLTSLIEGGKFSKFFFKFVALVLIALAIFNISNGLALANVKVSLPKSTSTKSTQVAQVDNGVQIVHMNQDSNGYSPYKFTVKKGVPVKWIITSDGSFSCAKSILMQQMNINTVLNAGENTIKFTPTEAGTLNFSCSMGMYRGQFIVE